MFIVAGPLDSLDDEVLYWSNDLGWVDRASATLFDSMDGGLPIDAEGWVEVTFRDLAEAAVARGELGTFDYALPLDWCDDVRAKTGESPFGFVWSYPPKSIWGEPFALTVEAAALLTKYEEARK